MNAYYYAGITLNDTVSPEQGREDREGDDDGRKRGSGILYSKKTNLKKRRK
jgi:hypothetical protein